MKATFKKGFTLIELLVVITIIGILATWAVTTFTGQIQKARDSTRISDLKALQGAVEQTYQDAGQYPLADTSANFDTAIDDYLPNVPEDSKNGQACESSTMCGYVYNVGDSNGAAAWWIAQAVYEFSAGFENKWNVDNRAADDDGNDPVRFEISNNSSVAPATVWASWAAPAANNWIIVQ